MNIIWQSVKFDEKNIVARYVKLSSNDEAHFYDVDSRSKTIREYWLNLSDVEEIERLEITAKREQASKPYEMLKLEHWKTEHKLWFGDDAESPDGLHTILKGKKS